MASQTFNLLQEMKNKAVNLYQRGVIKKCTEDFFLENYRKLREEVEFYKASNIEMSDENLRKTLNHLTTLIGTLEKMEKNDRFEHAYEDFFFEIFCKIHNTLSIDLWILPEDSGLISPSCFYHPSQGELAFILILPKHLNYFCHDLIGLLAHEVSHTYEPINEFLTSLRREKNKIGESLADLLSFIIIDSLFLHAMTYFVKHLIGTENSADVKPRHLSWSARIFVMNSLNKQIWQNENVRDEKHFYFEDLSDCIQQISPVEAMDIAKSVLEGERRIDDLVKFKINEDKLINIRNLTMDELETSEKIIQLIHAIKARN